MDGNYREHGGCELILQGRWIRVIDYDTATPGLRTCPLLNLVGSKKDRYHNFGL